MVHGGFLTYVFAFARLPDPPLPRPRFADINVELIATKPFAALRRSDREDVSPEAPEMPSPDARLDDAQPQRQPQPDTDGAIHEEADSGAKALADEMSAPLPEDGAREAVPLPLPERSGNHGFGANPPTDDTAPTSAPKARVRGGMSLPTRRMSLIPREEKLSKRGVADPRVESVLATLNATPPPPVKAPEKSALEADRASVSDMGAQGSPVVAMLPKAAGIAMFAARIAEPGPMLPEDRFIPAELATPVEAEASRPVPPPVRRTARLVPVPRHGETDPDSVDGKSARTMATAKKVGTFQAKVRAHLAVNKPAGGHGQGRVVVAFNLSAGGGVRSARIVQSSGSPSLDQSVLKSVFGSEPFPKPPEGLTPAQLRFVIPFEFR